MFGHAVRVEPSGVERIDARIRPRGQAHGLLHERPGLVGEKTLGKQDDAFPLLHPLEAVEEGREFVDREIAAGAHVCGELFRFAFDRHVGELTLRRVVEARAPDDLVEDRAVLESI